MVNKNRKVAMTSDVIKLEKKGFFPIYIRPSESGGYKIHEYTDNYGHERWVDIRLPKKQIESQIRKYRARKKKKGYLK